jgi:hypothetical protein
MPYKLEGKEYNLKCIVLSHSHHYFTILKVSKRRSRSILEMCACLVPIHRFVLQGYLCMVKNRPCLVELHMVSVRFSMYRGELISLSSQNKLGVGKAPIF